MKRRKLKSKPKTYPLFVLSLLALSLSASIWCSYEIYSWYTGFLPNVSSVKELYPVPTGKTGRKINFSFQKEKPKYWVSLKSLPKHVTAAILAAEDASFYQHKGYSSEAIRAAIEYNLRSDTKIKKGGSTITQQVVKNLFLSPEKTIIRKGRELLLALELERNVSKSRILETYLNIAEWGPQIYGINQASQRYFGKSPANLSPREAATLAFLLPNPKRYQYSVTGERESEFATRRIQAILEHMWRNGTLSDEEYASSVGTDTLHL